MRFLYQVMYRIGFTPWDTPGTPVPAVLREVIEGPKAIHSGRALDLGCGMGRHAIYLAAHGWQVTGIDSARSALRTARQRAEKARVKIDFVRGDVTLVDAARVGGPFDFFLDGGCFHGMSDDERRRYGSSITQVAAPDAEILLFSFGPSTRGVPPRGAERSDVERCFAGSWSIYWTESVGDMPDAMADQYPSANWYRLKRSSPGGS
jgi:SAM-dependent methyltransferase